jgi:hypothetical protein
MVAIAKYNKRFIKSGFSIMPKIPSPMQGEG